MIHKTATSLIEIWKNGANSSTVFNDVQCLYCISGQIKWLTDWPKRRQCVHVCLVPWLIRYVERLSGTSVLKHWINFARLLLTPPISYQSLRESNVRYLSANRWATYAQQWRRQLLCIICQSSLRRCQQLTAFSISTALVTKLLVIEQLLHPALKSAVNAPWPNFQLCPSSQQLLATPLMLSDKKYIWLRLTWQTLNWRVLLM